MTAIERIKATLQDHPGIRYTETAHGIEVHPTDDSGFVVSMRVDGPRITVHFDGWHEEFASEKDALDCFALGLSASCRLEVVYRGYNAIKCTLEWQRDGEWIQDSVTGLLLQPIWRQKRIVYRQNNLLPGIRPCRGT